MYTDWGKGLSPTGSAHCIEVQEDHYCGYSSIAMDLIWWFGTMACGEIFGFQQTQAGNAPTLMQHAALVPALTSPDRIPYSL